MKDFAVEILLKEKLHTVIMVAVQGLQNVLISIEERLRALDTLYSPRYTPRWEVSIEQQSRRMETMESRLRRVETLLELRLDKLSEVLSLYEVLLSDKTVIILVINGTSFYIAVHKVLKYPLLMYFL